MGCSISNAGETVKVKDPTDWPDANIIPERKVMLVGDYSVGITTIIQDYAGWVLAPTTTGCKIYNKTADVSQGGKNGRPFQLKLEIWNAAGSDNYRFLTKAFYNEAHAVVFVYAVDYPPSF